MRTPRDLDAELKALAAKTKALKAERLTRLGELVMATGADVLDPDILAGALIAAANTTDPAIKAAWAQQGAQVLRGRSHKAAKGPRRDPGLDGPHHLSAPSAPRGQGAD